MRHNASPCPFGRGPPTTDHHSAFMEGSKTYAKRSILGSRFIACINPDRRHGRPRYRYRFRPVASQQVIAGAARSPVQRVSIVPDSSPADQLNRADVARAKRTTPLDLGRSSGWACPRGRLLVRQIRPAIGPELDVEFIDAMLMLAETCILFAGVRADRRDRRRIVVSAAAAGGHGPCQPDPVLCRHCRGVRLHRRADRLCLWHCHLLVSGADHDHAAADCRQPHG
jgi:hypothetical protein